MSFARFIQAFLPSALVVLTWSNEVSSNQCDLKEPSDDDSVVIQLIVDNYILSESMFGYQVNQGDILLPLMEIARTLDLPFKVDSDTGIYSGWLFETDNVFVLDTKRCELKINKQQVSLDKSQLAKDNFDSYISKHWLEQWLDAEFIYMPLASQLMIKPHQKLPFQLQKERESKNQEIYKKDSASLYPSYIEPYQMISWPMFNINTTASYQQSYGDDSKAKTTAQYNALVMFDFLYMNTKLRVNGNENELFQNIRMTSDRVDLNGQLLGALAATQVSLGDVFTYSKDLLNNGQAGRGIKISNFPLTRASQFDQTELQGDLLPGWQIELYRNGTLIDFQQSEIRGRYHFTDIHLFYGRNELLLKFYGPHGETREELEVLDIGSNLIAKDQSYYQFALVDTSRSLFGKTEKQGISPQLRAQFNYEYGLDTGISWVGAVDSFPLQINGNEYQRHTYLNIGLRAAKFGSFFQLNYLQDVAQGHAWKASLQRGNNQRSIYAEHVKYKEFMNESMLNNQDSLSRKSMLRLNLFFSFDDFPDLSMTLDTTLAKNLSGKQTLNLNNSFSTKLGDFHLAHNLKFQDVWGQEPLDTLTGSLLLNTHLFSSQYRLRGELQYDIDNGPGLRSLMTQFDARINSKMNFKAAVKKNLMGDSYNKYTTSLDMDFNTVRVGISAAYNRETHFEFGLTVSGSFGFVRNPFAKSWSIESNLSERSGVVASRVFFDDNMNEQFDSGDSGIKDVSLIGQMNSIKSDKYGVSHAVSSAFSPKDMAVDIGTLQEPGWNSTQESLRVFARPGVVTRLEFPVVNTGEIDGTIFLKRGDKTKELSGITVLLQDLKGNIIKQVKTSYDGFYLFYNIKPGKYHISFLKDQLSQLNAHFGQSEVLEITKAGDIHNEQNIELILSL